MSAARPEVAPARPDAEYYRQPHVYALYKIEHWYPPLRHLTFETDTIGLTRAEAVAMARMCENFKQAGMAMRARAREEMEAAQGRDGAAGVIDHSTIFAKARLAAVAALTDHERALLESLRVRLDALVSRYPEGCFFKTSLRSPKDAGLSGKTVKKIIRDALSTSYHTPDSPAAHVEDLAVFIRASIFSLRVTSGEDALELLFASNRSFGDLKLAELTGGDGDEFDLQLIVRRWVNFDPLLELRVFVFDNAVTTISQYYSIAHVPLLAGARERIEREVLAFFAREVRDLPVMHAMRDYTLDLVLSSLHPSLIRIIEVNPPPPLAGGSLFDYDLPADRALILHGPVTTRVLASPLPLAESRSHIYCTLAAYIDQLRGRTLPASGSHVCELCRCSLSPEFVWCFEGDCVDAFFCSACWERGESATHPHPVRHVSAASASALAASVSSAGNSSSLPASNVSAEQCVCQ